MQFGHEEQIYGLYSDILTAAYIHVPSGLILIKMLSHRFTLSLTQRW